MIVRLRALAFAVAVSAAAIAAGCGPQPLPPGVTSFCPNSQTIAMVYPAPGATGVPDNLAGIVIAAQGTLDSGSNTVVVPAGNVGSISFSYLSSPPSPLPTPNATPGFTNAQYSFSSATQTLAASTTINAYYNDTSGVCQEVFLGAFNTK